MPDQNTPFAPLARASADVVRAQFNTFVGTHCRSFFDALPSVILALNCHRQVVFANTAAVNYLGYSSLEDILGKRPGEALNCINALDAPAGCGTSRHCRNCKAAQVIIDALKGVVGNGECALLRREQTEIEGLDLHVTATPITIEGESFVVFSLRDITHEMRRRSMERIFFHDVLNLAGGINGLAEHIRTLCNCGTGNELEVLHTASSTLVDEIVAQRELLAAETSELEPEFTAVGVRQLLEQLRGLYANSNLAFEQEVRLNTPDEDIEVFTDAHLVQRVLGNMLKNALEAGTPGDHVVLSCAEEGGDVVFTVWSRPFIPENLQDNIFRRRFSTKGEARGLGTYSMILLAERYLKGSVGFSSTEAEGTTFFLRLPKCLDLA